MLFSFIRKVISKPRPADKLHPLAMWLGTARLGTSESNASGQRFHRRWRWQRALWVHWDNRVLAGESTNLSGGGVGILLPEALPRGTVVLLGEPQSDSHVPGEIVYVASEPEQGLYRTGIEFISDAEQETAAQAPVETNEVRAYPALAAPRSAVAPPTPVADASPTEACEAAASPASDDGGLEISEAWWEQYTPPEHGAGPEELDLAADALDHDIVAGLQDAIESGAVALPTLPVIARHGLTLARATDVDSGELADTLKQDSSITALLLRQANAVGGAGEESTTRLESALGRLGRFRVHNLVLAGSVRRIALQSSTNNAERSASFWRRALASAVIAEAYAAHATEFEPEDAFLAGFVHDIGELVILRVLQMYSTSYDIDLHDDAIRALMRSSHESVGRHLANTWDIPAPLPEFIASHELREYDDALGRYRALVQFCDLVCAGIGLAPAVRCSFFETECVAALGINRDPHWLTWLAQLPDRVHHQVNAFA